MEATRHFLASFLPLCDTQHSILPKLSIYDQSIVSRQSASTRASNGGLTKPTHEAVVLLPLKAPDISATLSPPFIFDCIPSRLPASWLAVSGSRQLIEEANSFPLREESGPRDCRTEKIA